MARLAIGATDGLVNERTDEGSVVVASVGAIVVIIVAALLVGIRDWLGNTNVALLLVGLVVMVRRIARRRVEAAPLSKEEHEAAERLLSGGGAER